METKFTCPVFDGSGEIPPHWHPQFIGGRRVIGGTWCPWCEGDGHLNREDFVQAAGEEPGREDFVEG